MNKIIEQQTTKNNAKMRSKVVRENNLNKKTLLNNM